jgi:hypothetical protein
MRSVFLWNDPQARRQIEMGLPARENLLDFDATPVFSQSPINYQWR